MSSVKHLLHDGFHDESSFEVSRCLFWANHAWKTATPPQMAAPKPGLKVLDDHEDSTRSYRDQGIAAIEGVLPRCAHPSVYWQICDNSCPNDSPHKLWTTCAKTATRIHNHQTVRTCRTPLLLYSATAHEGCRSNWPRGQVKMTWQENARDLGHRMRLNLMMSSATEPRWTLVKSPACQCRRSAELPVDAVSIVTANILNIRSSSGNSLTENTVKKAPVKRLGTNLLLHAHNLPGVFMTSVHHVIRAG